MTTAANGPAFDFQARPNEPVVEATRWFAAQPVDVFAAWATPEHLCRWWGPPGTTLRQCDVDLRVGGRYRIHMERPDGGSFTSSGVFVELDAPKRLVTNYSVDGVPGSEVVEVTSFEGVSGGTLVRVVSLHRSCAARDSLLADGTAQEAVAEAFASLDADLGRPTPHPA